MLELASLKNVRLAACQKGRNDGSGRTDAVALPDNVGHWRRRNGRGLPGHRHDAGARCRHQGAAARSGPGHRAPRTIPARGPPARLAEPPEHRRHLRARRSGRAAVHRARTGRGRGPQAAARARRDSPRRGTGDRRADRRSARGSPQPGHRPPRPEARERQAHARRQGEGARLRPREGVGRRVPRRSIVGADGVAVAHARTHRHDRRRDPRDGRLHGAGAGARASRWTGGRTCGRSACCCGRC